MLTRIRELSREEDGQALVLAALLLFAVALGVLGTANLAQGIHQRIELQNAADAAAYSLAAHEARAFNFYAYTNRAQISQYVTIMQLLSVDSMLLGVLAGLGAFAAVLKTVGELCSGVKRPVCLLIPVVGEVLVAISVAASVIEPIVRAAGVLFTAFDAFVGTVAVPLLVGANLFLFANQAAFAAGVMAAMGDDETLRIARGSSPHAELWRGGIAQALGNGLRFAGAHFRAAMHLGGTSGPSNTGLRDGPAGEKNFARRGMGELIHATRYDSIVYSRRFGAALSRVTGFKAFKSFADLLPQFGVRGHTRLHSDPAPRPAEGPMERYYRQMEQTGKSVARYPTGGSIGANFYFQTPLPDWIAKPLGLNQRHIASVTSTGRAAGGGWACTWDLRRPYRTIPLGVTKIYAPRLDCRVNRGLHPWWGITPYMAFDSADDGCERHASEQCQPDVWVALRLPEEHVNLAGGGTAGAIDVDVATPSGVAHASNTNRQEGGMKAVSRALAYYHRPGAWQEAPNFFNPFWRAKLAPVQSGIDRLASEAGAPGLRQMIPPALGDEVITH